MAREKGPTEVVTGRVRLSYAHIWEKYKNENDEGDGKEKYSTALLWPKSDAAATAKLEAAIEAAITVGKAKFGAKYNPKSKEFKLPIRDGDLDKPGDPNYAGQWFLNCSANNKPGIIDAQKNEVLDKDEVYSGCYCKVSLNMFPFDGNGKKYGVGAGLGNIMKVADGEKLSGGSTAEEDFADVSADDDDDI
jgi:hypothetical protein